MQGSKLEESNDPLAIFKITQFTRSYVKSFNCLLCTWN